MNDYQDTYYTSRLVRYTTDSGNWGKWIWNERMNSYDSAIKSSVVLHYAVIPEELDGQTLISLSYFSYDTQNNRNDFVLNLANNRIDVYDYATSEYVTSINKGDADVNVKTGSNNIYVSWDEGKISFRKDSTYTEVREILSTSTSAPHYEMLNEDNLSTTVEANYDKRKFPLWDKDGNIVGNFDNTATTSAIRFNTTGSSISVSALVEAGSFPTRMFVPTQSGTQGQVLQSAGDGEPTWIDKSAVTNGVSFAKLTQDEYDALETKDPNTLYIIVEEE